jgi:hypothetical protein
MNANKYRYFWSLLLISTFGLSVFAQKQTAVETVEAFYKFHNTRSGIFSLHEVKLRKRWLTAELYKLFLNEVKREDEFTKKNPDEKPHFGDGFPLQPFAECVVDEKVVNNLYEANEISADPTKATVEIKFYSPAPCGKKLLDTYKIELVKTKNVWLIADWIYADGARLTSDLKRKEY